MKSSNSQAIKLITLLVISVLLLITDLKYPLINFRDAIQTYVVFPTKHISQTPVKIYSSFSNYFVNQNALTRKVDLQSKEITWLRTSLANQVALEAENKRLKMLFESTYHKSQPVMVASVIDSFIDYYRHEIVIDKGSNKGAFIGQVVVNENGIMGQITKILPNSATVSLITDPSQRVPVFIERNLQRMVTKGSGLLDELDIDFISLSADIKVGDVLISSGLGGTFPRGYKVAVITSVEKDMRNLLTLAKAKPTANMNKSLEVLLIKTDDN